MAVTGIVPLKMGTDPSIRAAWMKVSTAVIATVHKKGRS